MTLVIPTVARRPRMATAMSAGAEGVVIPPSMEGFPWKPKKKHNRPSVTLRNLQSPSIQGPRKLEEEREKQVARQIIQAPESISNEVVNTTNIHNLIKDTAGI